MSGSTTAPMKAYLDAKNEYTAGLFEAETLSRNWAQRNDPAWGVALHRVAFAICRMNIPVPAPATATRVKAWP